MSRPCLSLFLAVALSMSLLAQAPTGTIAGIVTDESGAVVPGAKVTIINKETAAARTLESGPDGNYSAPALTAGEYEVRAEAAGFRLLVRPATVATGSTTTVNLGMQLGATKDVVTVEGAVANVNYDTNTVEGVVSRRQIENLPLNGRSFTQLAFLEPGVTVATTNPAQFNAQFNVSVLGGAASRTAITVDGGNVRNPIEGGVGTNFSQEVVQEFQLSSVNFDLSTGITSVGAINVVTRSGGNDFHGAGYFYFRDHNMSAYPGLARNALAPDPFFVRRQAGFWVGGPIKKDRLFFFFNLENLNQSSVYVVQPSAPSLVNFSQTAAAPYLGKQLSGRFDYRLSNNHTLFARYSHDGNHNTGPFGAPTLPSNWVLNRNWSDQSIGGITSTFGPALVNDFRFSYWYWQNRNQFSPQSGCPAPCLGYGLPEINIIGTNFAAGNNFNAPQGRDLRRYIWSDNITWQKGSHRMKFGGDYERDPGTGYWGYATPARIYLYSPEILGAAGRKAFGLPDKLSTFNDLLRLPLVYFYMGIGDIGQPPSYNLDQAKSNDRTHLYWQDTWRVAPKFTLNYGVGWEFESNLTNNDLTKPAFLAPLVGGGKALNAPPRHFKNFEPALGFAWNIGNDNKTVVRAGMGIYFDTQLVWQRLQERSEIGPVGNGRQAIVGSSVPNPLAGIPGAPQGSPIHFVNGPTGFTLGALLPILPQLIANANAQYGSTGQAFDLSTRAIQLSKQGDALFPYNYPTSYGEHFNIGVQREVSSDVVVTADFVYRHFVHQIPQGAGNFFGSTVDFNHYNAASGPVIPKCTSVAQARDPNAECSTGNIGFWWPGGTATYKALLVKVDKRFSRRFQGTVSYALQDSKRIIDVGADLSNYFASYGPDQPRHVLNFSGIVDLPWGFQVSMISQITSRNPFEPILTNIDLTGNGAGYTALPGAKYGTFNFGKNENDLRTLVAQFNQNYAGKVTPRGQKIPTITLPDHFQLGDKFASQDLRVSKIFNYRERYRLNVFGEVFNVFNISNLSQYSNDLTNSGFGQPSQRVGQIFGSGGPRAFQVGARLSF